MVNKIQLLAKPGVLILEHSLSVYRCNNTLLEYYGSEICNNLRIDHPLFTKISKMSAFIHDFLKANSHFLGILEDAINHKFPFDPQAIRHEHLIILMFENEFFKKWLLPYFDNNEDHYYMCLWAIAGHHRKEIPKKDDLDRRRGDIIIHSQHEHFHECFEAMRKEFSLPPPPPEIFSKNEAIEWPVVKIIGTGITAPVIKMFCKVIQREEERRRRFSDEKVRLACALKMQLVAADVIASAFPEMYNDVLNISRSAVPSKEDLKKIIEKRIGNNELKAFQKEAATADNRIVLINAPCAQGKTIASVARCYEKYYDKRIFYNYPTTTSATEGFKDYFYGGFAASFYSHGLFHSRASVDEKYIIPLIEDEADASNKIKDIEYSLKGFTTPIFCCTADRTLGILQNIQKSQILFPFIATGVFIFDEIHNYPDELFNLLVEFIRFFRVPAILVTATMPQARLKAIQDIED